MTPSVLDQLPALSKFDPGEVGEGSLDPLGLGAVAERIAECLVPGLRARMSLPRFVTLSAIGAHACQSLSGITSPDGKTTFDLAFEWMVVEALVRNRGDDRLAGVPGSRKAQRARAAGERLCAANYLAGPRVFGFTGVTRPFSIDSKVLQQDGLPGENAERLLTIWESDRGLNGFYSGRPGEPGAKFRRDIESAVRASLSKRQCAAPPTGELLRALAGHVAPREAGPRERAELRRLVTSEHHRVRHELTRLMLADMPPTDAWPTQKELVTGLFDRARGPATRTALRAAIAYEECATAIEYAYRRLLKYGVAEHGGVFSVARGAETPGITELAPRVAVLVRRAIDAAGELDEGLGIDVGTVLGTFERGLTGTEFVEVIIERHEHVQAAKEARMWITPTNRGWYVRPLYRDRRATFDDEIWTHPLRLQTLLGFLVRTS